MKDSGYQKIRFHILNKLHLRRKWGASHTSFDMVSKGLPSHQIGDAKKNYKRINYRRSFVEETVHKGVTCFFKPREEGRD